MKPKHIVILGYDGVMGLDLVGPMEAFASAQLNSPKAGGDACYRVTIAALEEKTFRSEFGLTLTAERSLAGHARCRHTAHSRRQGLARVERPSKAYRLAAARYAGSTRRIASICTGIYGLAPSGLLNGRRVATHWRFTADLAKRYPKLKVDPGSLYVRDGKFWTAAGVTAGIDLSLALIEEDFGSEVALSVARELVVYMKRSGGQEQYSEPLQFQTQSRSRFADLLPWIVAHLEQDLSVEALAARFLVCARGSSRGALPKSLGVARLRLCGDCGWMKRGSASLRRSVRWKA